MLGITASTTATADESFSVYDHPPVWIFTRSGRRLSADQIKSDTDRWRHAAWGHQRVRQPEVAATRSGAQDANAGAPPLGVQFPANSLANQIPLIWWLLIVELLGLVAFPLAFSAFPGLRDRGWGLSKLLGLLIVAYAVWLPSSLRLLPFDRWAVWLVFGRAAGSVGTGRLAATDALCSLSCARAGGCS